MFPRCSRIRASEFRNHLVGGLAPTFLQSCSRAVKIQNNAEQNVKELAEIVRNAETRNKKERKGILIGPSMAPRFSLVSFSMGVGAKSQSKNQN